MPSEKSLDQPAEWTPPAESDENVYDTAVGDMGDILRFRHNRDIQDLLVDFAIIQMTRHDGELACVAEIDIRHGYLHVHYYNQQGRRVGQPRDIGERPVTSQKDVDDSYASALAWIEENWEDCKWRWGRG